MSFSFDDFRRRKLVQWTLGYLAAGFAVLQLLEFVGNSFHWPDYITRIATVVFGFGALAVLVLAWFHGERGAQRATRLEIALLALITVTGGITAARFAGPGSATTKADVDENSVVVLPFQNRSGNAQDEFFSDGVSEEIMNTLGRIPNLRVPARTSSFAFKNTKLGAPDIARQLKVRYVLEGSVQRVGDVVRISATLIDGPNDRAVWNDQFERDARDVFAVEDDISRAIAEKLRLRLLDAKNGTSNPEAHEQYLRGRYLLAKSRPPRSTKACRISSARSHSIQPTPPRTAH